LTLDPSDTLDEAATLVAALLRAIDMKTPKPLMALLEPQGPLACAYDLWGWPALEILVSWGEAAVKPQIEVALEAPDRATATVRWGAQGHGSLLELRRRRERWQAYAAVPRAHEDSPVNPAYALAEAAGPHLAWREPTHDLVETLLRSRGLERTLGLTALLERVLLWRLAAASLKLPPLTAETWAAAMEYQLLRRSGENRAAEMATACYGASRRDLERATFLLEAGWRLKVN
jgi:hypothetical protein